MDPNQLPQPGQAPAPPDSGGQFNPGQYDFITSPVKPPKKTLLPTSGSSKSQRIIIFVIGMILLLVLLIAGYNLATSGSRPNTAQLTTVLQQQTELIRVTEIGTSKGGSEEAKAIATKTQLVIVTQNQKLQSTMNARKIKFNKKVLDDTKNTKTDQTLNTALQNGRFDDAFIQQVRTSLEDYRKALKTAYQGSNSQGVRDVLNEDYKQVNILLEDITGQPQT